MTLRLDKGEIPVIWSENLQIPVCDYCKGHRRCVCGAAEAEQCEYCDIGCDCGYEQVLNDEVCSCDCSCEEGDDGNCSDCCQCSYPLIDDLPNSCYCSCECEPCLCRCSCPTLVIDADSYNDWVRSSCYICPPGSLAPEYLNRPVLERRNTIPLGSDFEFFIRTLPASHMRREAIGGFPLLFASNEEIREYEWPNYIDVIQDGFKSKVRFSGPVLIPMVGEYSPYSNEPRIWMSLTPMEVFTQMPGVKKAYGNVLIGGLGMGWLTNKVLQKPEVEQVVQLELHPEILEVFGKPLTEMYPGRIQLVLDDVYQFLSQVGPQQFDTILLDIWPRYTGANQDSQFKQLQKIHPNIWGWGEYRVKNKSSN